MDSIVYQVTSLSDFSFEVAALSEEGILDLVFGFFSPFPSLLVIFVFSFACLFVKKIALVVRG